MCVCLLSQSSMEGKPRGVRDTDGSPWAATRQHTDGQLPSIGIATAEGRLGSRLHGSVYGQQNPRHPYANTTDTSHGGQQENISASAQRTSQSGPYSSGSLRSGSLTPPQQYDAFGIPFANNMNVMPATKSQQISSPLLRAGSSQTQSSVG